MKNQTPKFEIGKTYIMTFITDSNLKTAWTVIKRTAKTVTIESQHGCIKTRRIKMSDYAGLKGEYVLPHGQYSMSPALRAINIRKDLPKNKSEDLDDNAQSWLWMCG